MERKTSFRKNLILSMISLASVGSLGAVWHHWHKKKDVSKGPTQQDKIEYIKNWILPEKAFQISQGPLQTSPFILVIFTSMACHVCRDFHLKYRPAITALPLFKAGDLSLVFVEYPADPLSLHVAAHIWALEKRDIKTAHHKVFEAQEQWMGPDLKGALEKVKTMLKSAGFAANPALLPETLLRSIFDSKMKGHKAFGMSEIPFCVLIDRQNPQAWVLETLTGDIGLENFLSWIRGNCRRQKSRP